MIIRRIKSIFSFILILPLCLIIAVSPQSAYSQEGGSVSFLTINEIVMGSLTISSTIYVESSEKEQLDSIKTEIINLLIDFDRNISTKRLAETVSDDEQSYIWKFNNNYTKDTILDGEVRKYPLDYHGYTMLKRAKDEFFEQTNGLFDPTIFPLVQLWELDYGPWADLFGMPAVELSRIPSKQEIADTLSYCGIDKIELYEKDGAYSISKTDDRVKIDLGAQAKGYACDIVVNILDKYNIIGATINLSGNLYIYGYKPITDDAQREKNSDGSFKPYYTGTYTDIRPFNSGIANPFHNCGVCEDDVLVRFKLGAISAVTSGDYNRYKTYNGVRFSHVINPKTGYPVNVDPNTLENINGLTSATIYGASSEKCDVYATAVLLSGMQDGIEYCREMGLQAVLVGNDYRYANLTDFEIVEDENGYSAGAWASRKFKFKAVSEDLSFGELKTAPIAWIAVLIVAGVFAVLLGFVCLFRVLRKRKDAKPSISPNSDDKAT